MSIDELIQIFSPIVTSARVMGWQFSNSYISIQCEDGINLVFDEVILVLIGLFILLLPKFYWELVVPFNIKKKKGAISWDHGLVNCSNKYINIVDTIKQKQMGILVIFAYCIVLYFFFFFLLSHIPTKGIGMLHPFSLHIIG